MIYRYYLLTRSMIVDGIVKGTGTASTKSAAKEAAAKEALEAMGVSV